nr:MAG TPA: hypothetical protein [Caudoviricetes sp.]
MCFEFCGTTHIIQSIDTLKSGYICIIHKCPLFFKCL